MLHNQLTQEEFIRVWKHATERDVVLDDDEAVTRHGGGVREIELTRQLKSMVENYQGERHASELGWKGERDVDRGQVVPESWLGFGGEFELKLCGGELLPSGARIFLVFPHGINLERWERHPVDLCPRRGEEEEEEEEEDVR